MSLVLCVVFFFSGVAALIFEALWLRLAGLTFGNSVWASSLVLASFMGGLALGNALAAFWGRRINRTVRFYAFLEFLIGISGFSLVLLFPYFTDLFSPIFQPLMDQPSVLNGLRLCLAFLLLLIPSSAMGATLPILVRGMFKKNPLFGQVLGRLYGWNTLGGVVGAVVGELILYQKFGLLGTGGIALTINIFVGFFAWVFLSRHFVHTPSTKPTNQKRFSLRITTFKGNRLLVATFLTGATLLALEVVWFRFSLLFHLVTSLNFSIMLAVVLSGIGLGGLIASYGLRYFGRLDVYLSTLAILASILVVISYSFYEAEFLKNVSDDFLGVTAAVKAALGLMLPVSLVSGMLFTLMGESLKREMEDETRCAGMLTLFNTCGAMCGAILAGFVLLPKMGMEKCFFLCAIAYGIIAVLMWDKAMIATAARRVVVSVSVVCFVCNSLLFPFGLMDNYFVSKVVDRFTDKDGQLKSHLVDFEEGLTETVMLIRHDFLDEPYQFSLITNSHAMSASHLTANRYMKAFVYWPVAFQEEPRNALLMCYGIGTTAKALTDTESLNRIDVVDISNEILQVSSKIFQTAPENPLNDPRIHVHIEDGRHFLQTTSQYFDIITGEPPPPKNAGIVNLYTQEFFALARDRLSETGLMSYWLPVADLHPDDVKSIILAFCLVFQDATLWTGAGMEWMLMGSRGGHGTVSAESFTKQWRDPVVAPELQALGFERVGFVGATFLADHDQLMEVTKSSLPLTDNFPSRLTRRNPLGMAPWHWDMLSSEKTKERFEKSQWIREHWPPELREEALNCFQYQGLINAKMIFPSIEKLFGTKNVRENLHNVLNNTPYQFLPLWLRNSDDRQQDLVDKFAQNGVADFYVSHQLALREMARRDYLKADHFFGLAYQAQGDALPLYQDWIYVLCMAGEFQKARDLTRQVISENGVNSTTPEYWQWLKETFQLDWIISAQDL